MADHLKLAANHYENFPVGSILLPRVQRTHLHRIYAFARTADDLADEVQSATDLAAFRTSFEDHLGDPGNRAVPLLHDLVQTIRDVDLPPQLFFDLLDAFATDLELGRHDRESLMAYCRKSANPVGRLVLRVFGYRSDELDGLSDQICTALQIVNHLQDIREDLQERDRVYLPREDLEELGIELADLSAPSATPALRALVRRWADRSAAWLCSGWPLTRQVKGRLRWELRAILHGVARVLRHLRRLDHDPLSEHIRLSKWEKVSVVGRGVCMRKMPPDFAPSAT